MPPPVAAHSGVLPANDVTMPLQTALLPSHATSGRYSTENGGALVYASIRIAPGPVTFSKSSAKSGIGASGTPGVACAGAAPPRASSPPIAASMGRARLQGWKTSR